MYIIYSNNGKYASAAVSKRHGKKTSISYIYLGTVIDKEKGIYQNKERGLFTFDPKTETYGSVPDSFVPPKIEDKRKHDRLILDFGDVFFVNAYLHKSGFMDVVDTIGYGNPDTFHTMILFYILSSLSNYNAQVWYDGSIVKMLYPKANLSSQRISDFLQSIGSPEKQLVFQKAYIDFVLGKYDKDKNILVDSSGLPNGIHMPLTAMNNHNGKLSNEARLVFVVQRSTGLPLYYKAVPGNVVDSTTLERILLHVDSLGLNVDSCIIDAGYNTNQNLDLFYNEDHTCKIDYITRVKGNDAEYATMIYEELDTLDRKENFVKYGDRYLFIKKKQVFVGKEKNNPAWMYLGLDCGRMNDERRQLWKRAFKNSMGMDEVFDSMQKEGLFGVISGKEYSCEEILPGYYQRQSAEQIFDFAKNYTKMLPLRTHSEANFQGHLLLAYIASCAVKMMHIVLKSTDLIMGSRLACMRNQKCTVYDKRIVVEYPQKDANDTYKAFQIVPPTSISIENGIMQYTAPESEYKKSSESATDEATNSETTQETPDETVNPSANERKTAEQHKAKGMVPRKSSNQTTNDKSEPAVSNGIESKNSDETTNRRGPGRPAGSKNKSTLEKERLLAEAIANGTAQAPLPKRGKGRPKGAKNKATLQRERELAEAIANGTVPAPGPKRGRGRPKGSKNKLKQV